MKVTRKIKIDLARNGLIETIDSVQFDSNTRSIEIALFENSVPWEVPSGATAAIAFRKPDGNKGLYDELPNKSKAVATSGNVVTAVLAPQVLSTAGNVDASVVFHDSELNQLATFPFQIIVAENPSSDGIISNDYYKYSTMEEISDAVDATIKALEKSKEDFLAKAEEALEVVHDTAAQDAPAIVCQAAGDVIVVTDAAHRPLQGLSIYGKTTQSGTPTPTSPVPLKSAGESGAISVTVAGKNLFGGDALADKLVEVASATKDESAGTVMFFSGNVSEKVILENCFKENTRYTFIFNGRNSGTGSRALNLHYEYTDGMVVGNQYFDKADEFSCYVYTSEAGKTLKSLRGSHHSYSTILEYNKCGVFEGVLTEADFESYKGQTLTVSTPNGLNGIGEVRDEIDFARGVRVQRIGIVDIGTINWNHSVFSNNRQVFHTGTLPIAKCKDVNAPINAMCELYRAASQTESWTHGVIGYHELNGKILDIVNNDYTDSASFKAAMSGVMLLYELAEPIETPLSAEELASFASLHSNKPNTTAFNDGGAGLKLAYNADTKLYIDNKINELATAILNNA